MALFLASPRRDERGRRKRGMERESWKEKERDEYIKRERENQEKQRLEKSK